MLANHTATQYADICACVPSELLVILQLSIQDSCTQKMIHVVSVCVRAGPCLIWSHSTRLSLRWRLTGRGTTLCFLPWTALQVCLGLLRLWRGCHFKTCYYCVTLESVEFAAYI